MELRLVSQMTCKQCGGKAPLAFQSVNKELEDRTMVEIEGMPVYACTSCGHTQMELMSRATLEEQIQNFIDTSGYRVGSRISVALKWQEPQAGVPVVPVQQVSPKRARVMEFALA